MNYSSYEKKTYLIYLLMNGVLLGVSFVALIWNLWAVPMSFGFGYVFGLVNLALLLNQGKKMASDPASATYTGSVAGRQLIMLVAVAAPALILYLNHPENNMVFLSLLATGVPFLSISGILAAYKPKEEEMNQESEKYMKSLPEKKEEKKEKEKVSSLEYFDKLADYGFSKTSWNILTQEQKQKVLVQIADGTLKIESSPKKEDQDE
jgi:hypothetical protein